MFSGSNGDFCINRSNTSPAGHKRVPENKGSLFWSHNLFFKISFKRIQHRPPTFPKALARRSCIFSFSSRLSKVSTRWNEGRTVVSTRWKEGRTVSAASTTCFFRNRAALKQLLNLHLVELFCGSRYAFASFGTSWPLTSVIALVLLLLCLLSRLILHTLLMHASIKPEHGA